MEAHKCFSSTQRSVPSPNAEIIATIHQSRLVLRSSADGSVLRTILLDNDFAARCTHLRWLPRRELQSEVENGNQRDSPFQLRFLIADDDKIHVYDATDAQWHAAINGASSTMGKIANVEFGYKPDEVLVFSDFSTKVTIWSLKSSRGVEIRDPKFSRRGHCFRPRTGHLAMLTRPDTRDVVVLLAPRTHGLVHSFVLATVDAQGLKWSPDGRWLAIWEAASAGYMVFIYTADGHLFKTYHGGQDTENVGLGIKGVEWDPTGKYLAVGTYDDQVTLLYASTFHPIAILEHSSTITSPNALIYQEQIDASKSRSYTSAPQPAYPPTQPNEGTQPAAVSIMTFSIDGDFLATRSDATPTTVWIWSLQSLAPATILIHHSPIKSLQWHPTDSHLLMIHCASPDPTIHLWNPSWDTPRIINNLHLKNPAGKPEPTWVYSPPGGKPKLLFGNAQNYVLISISPTEGELSPLPTTTKSIPILEGRGPEDMFDEGNSMDLSPIKINHNDFTARIQPAGSSSYYSGSGSGVFDNFGGAGAGDGHSEAGQWGEISEEVDDTFDFRKRLPVSTST